jgi:hypothetical protein
MILQEVNETTLEGFKFIRAKSLLHPNAESQRKGFYMTTGTL